MTSKLFFSLTNKLAIILFLALLFFPYNLTQAVPDPAGSPTLAWQKETESSSTSPYYNAIKVYGGSLYIAGTSYSDPEGAGQWWIEKRNLTTGALITGFGTNGVVTENPSEYYDDIYAITADSTGLYLVGTDSSLGTGNGQWRIEKRDLTDGSLIDDFGPGGVVTENPGVFNDYPYAVAFDSTGLYVAGFDFTAEGSGEWRIEKRDLTDGSLIDDFGIDGIVIEDPSGEHEFIQSIALNNTGLYVTGKDSSPGSSQWRIEKRDLTDGSLIDDFGTGGFITENPSDGDDSPYAIALNSSGLYVAGWDSSPGDARWRIEKRDLTTGEQITDFGTGGVVTENPSDGDDFLYGLVLNNSSLYVTGGDESNGTGNWQWRTEKRDLTNGALVSNFGTNGVITQNFGDYDDEGSAIDVDESGVYIAGWNTADAGWAEWSSIVEKYAFPEDTTPPTFDNLPGTLVPINITEGQTITTNPYVIEVKAIDNIAVAQVNFFVDNIQICTDTTADSEGLYTCSWDTSKYHSDIRVVAYDTTGNPSEPLLRTTIVDPSLYVTTLPETGREKTNSLTFLVNLFKKLF
jgi:hypothetical protein